MATPRKIGKDRRIRYQRGGGRMAVTRAVSLRPDEACLLDAIAREMGATRSALVGRLIVEEGARRGVVPAASCRDVATS